MARTYGDIDTSARLSATAPDLKRLLRMAVTVLQDAHDRDELDGTDYDQVLRPSIDLLDYIDGKIRRHPFAERTHERRPYGQCPECQHYGSDCHCHRTKAGRTV